MARLGLATRLGCVHAHLPDHGLHVGGSTWPGCVDAKAPSTHRRSCSSTWPQEPERDSQAAQPGPAQRYDSEMVESDTRRISGTEEHSLRNEQPHIYHGLPQA